VPNDFPASKQASKQMQMQGEQGTNGENMQQWQAFPASAFA